MFRSPVRLFQKYVGIKLSSIVAAFCLVIGLLLYLLIAEKNIAIEFAEKELQGCSYLQHTRVLLEGIQHLHLAMGRSSRTSQSSQDLSWQQADLHLKTFL